MKKEVGMKNAHEIGTLRYTFCDVKHSFLSLHNESGQYVLFAALISLSIVFFLHKFLCILICVLGVWSMVL